MIIYLFRIAVLVLANDFGRNQHRPSETRPRNYRGASECRYRRFDLCRIVHSYLQVHFESKSALYWPV